MQHGGKRANSNYRLTSSQQQPIVSIITVVYNSIGLLEHTIHNILAQTYTNIEYVIIDGGSTDGTLELIKSYDAQLSYWQSEPDKGLYDAMNKGLQAATGDYVWFINSGDLIYNPETLTQIIAQNNTADIIYGDVVFMNSAWEVLAERHKYTPQKVPKTLNVNALHLGMCVCHQALIVRRSIAPMYKLKYKINSDYDWEIGCVKNAKSTHNTELILAKFLTGGVATRQIKKGLQERWSVMLHHFGWLQTVQSHAVILARGLWYYFNYLIKRK
jgi:glycosyltransferase involved in cell wall biosynthesis